MAGIIDAQIDPDIVERLKKGDRRAQEVVFKTLSGPVYTMAKRILGDPDQAAEVTQDTFVDVICKAASIRDLSAFNGWVRRIAVNHCLMRLRSPWMKNREELARMPEAVSPYNTDRALDIESALNTLNATARTVVWLYCAEGYSHEEIGDLFRKSASFSKSQLARALNSLSINTQSEGNPAVRLTAVTGSSRP